MDLDAEPGAPRSLWRGATLTMELPARGRIQVRVQELLPRRITLVTLRGHPLAGAVRLLSEPRGDLVRFEVQVYDRASNIADWLIMHPVGAHVQRGNWEALLERVVQASGGEAAGEVEHESETLDAPAASEVEQWIAELVRERRRDERQHGATPPSDRAPRPAAAGPGGAESGRTDEPRA